MLLFELDGRARFVVGESWLGSCKSQSPGTLEPGTLESWNPKTLVLERCAENLHPSSGSWNSAISWIPATLESWNAATWTLISPEPRNLETLPHDVVSQNPITLKPWTPGATATLDLCKSGTLQP